MCIIDQFLPKRRRHKLGIYKFYFDLQEYNYCNSFFNRIIVRSFSKITQIFRRKRK